MGSIDIRKLAAGAAALVVCAAVGTGFAPAAGAEVAPIGPAGASASGARGDTESLDKGKQEQIEAIIRDLPRRGPNRPVAVPAPPPVESGGRDGSTAAQVAVGAVVLGYALSRRRSVATTAP